MSNMIENGNYCVYVHTSPFGKKYIGQTGIKPERRWGKNGSYYLHKKKNGEYAQPAFANAILKYGWENFDHEIIASNLTKEEANNFEKLLIEKLNTMNSKCGYNLREGGHNSCISEESKKKSSESHKGLLASEKNPNARKVSQYDLYGNLIKVWNCIRDAERELNLSIHGVYKCCRGERKTCGGFIWKYYEDIVKIIA